MTGWMECLLGGGGGGGAGKEEDEESGEWRDGDGKKGGDTWKGGGIGMEGETGKTGEARRRGFPLALSLLGSIRPSHIVEPTEVTVTELTGAQTLT